MAGAPHPTSAALVTDQLLAITWSDGLTLHYPTDHLRAHCPCAHCARAPGEAPPARGQFAGVRLVSLAQIGNYAFQIGFDDGHAVGIYGFPRLREIGFPAGEAPPPATKPPSVFDV